MLFNPISVGLMYLFVFLSRLVFMRFGVHDSRTITVFLVITVFYPTDVSRLAHYIKYLCF